MNAGCLAQINQIIGELEGSFSLMLIKTNVRS